MPVDIVELVLKIPAINSSMREEFMVCKLDFEFCVQLEVEVVIERGTNTFILHEYGWVFCFIEGHMRS